MFADTLYSSIKSSKSVVVAGFDPRLEAIPEFILKESFSKNRSEEDSLNDALFNFHKIALESLTGKIAAIKPNLAFFEQYGIAGVRAFASICDLAHDMSLPVIVDGKRGDIGTTAVAYSNAYLGKSIVNNHKKSFFSCDALTVNPFLGFDTLEIFLKDCIEYGKGIFILAQTSNPGAKALQGLVDKSSNKTLSFIIAEWIYKNGSALKGKSGFSGLGAVVGATYPEQAAELRNIMKDNLFLVPGYGAQGGTAKDLLPNFDARGAGAIINISRALLSSFSSLTITESMMREEINQKISGFNNDINSTLSSAGQS
ncbi:MAG: orotidine-5'-phosphate decarboxylase [bacterium]|nr:orotidine-5'-phosphate decarboxylase [bacterium]